MQKSKQKVWIKPNVVGCEYCGTDFNKSAKSFHGVYCSIKCAAERSVIFAYHHLVDNKSYAETSSWNGETQYPRSHTGFMPTSK